MINKYEASNVDAKVICVLCNIIDLQIALHLNKRTSKKSKIINLQILFYGRWSRGTSGTYMFYGLCPDVIWETYVAPHILHMECLLVSLFSLTSPSS